VEYVRWETVSRYLGGFGFSQQVGKDDFIPENIFYKLCFKAENHTAIAFQDKVTDEILPAIRKHGAYLTPQKIEEVLLNPDTIITLATQIKELQAKVQQDAPKVLFASAVETSNTSILIGDLAKLLRQNGVEIGQNRLFQWLRDNHYLMRDNMPTQYGMERGWFEVKERTVNNPDGSVRIAKTPKVTGKGQTYFINRFLGK
jgi:anti-repressor protein